MAIEKMKRLKLVAVKSERESLLKELMLLGCVQISEPELHSPDAEEAEIFTKETAGLSEFRADYERLLSGIELLNKYVPEKTGLFSPKPEVSRQSVLDESSLKEYIELAKSLDDADDKIKRLTVEESRIKGLIETLEPWVSLEVPLELSETKTCVLMPGVIPSTVDLKTLKAELAADESESQIFEVSSDRDLHYLLLVAMKENQAKVLEIVRRFGFAPSSVSNMKGTAKENISDLKKKLSALETDRKALTSQIEAAASSRYELKLSADRMLTKAGQAENAERLLCTESTINFEGWIPAREEKKLYPVLSRFNCAWETSEPTEEDIEYVPVKLQNNAVTQPFSILTEMYSLPAYNGIDPNPFLFTFFPMFFGIMLADLGYGLLLFLGGFMYKKKAKLKGSQANVAVLLMICGIATAIFGALSGSFFGDAIPQVAKMYGAEIEIPSLINPLADPMTVLIGALILGFIQLIVGTALNGYMLIRDGQWMDAVFDVGSLWLLFLGLALGVMGATWYVAYAGVAMIVLTQGRSSPTIGGKIGGGLFSLYSIASGWFGDVLSYCRLMALMLAGAVIAQVFNTLGTMTGNIVAFLLLFIVGHLLNLGLNIIGSFVHSLRLQYLEFFGKFYREGGKPYQPLTIKTNYVNIIKED